jgi:hypothetical protein
MAWHGGKMQTKSASDQEPNQELNNYLKLSEILSEAFHQAALGKGRERHAENLPFEHQPIMWIERHFTSFQLGQAVKKIHESQRISGERAVAELLGAIAYIAAHILSLRGDKV